MFYMKRQMTDFQNTSVRPSFHLLSQDQIEEFHRSTLELLEKAGIRVLHPEALDLLQKNGCTVKDGKMVFFPGWLVEECIRSAPSRITIYDRLGKEAMRLEGRNSYFGTGTDLISTVDQQTRRARPSCLQDVINAAWVADACPEIDFIASFGLPQEVPINSMYLRNFKILIENSTKPIFFTAAGKEDLEYILDIAGIVAGGDDLLREKPFLVHYSEPTPPRSQSIGAVNKLFICAQRLIPICYTPAAMLGGSAPVTLAGGIVQTNAEALSGLVIHQLKHKGAPIISGVAATPFDMRAATVTYGTPDQRLTNSAFSDLYHYYGLPMWSTAASDSHCLDEQAAMEYAFSTLMAALDGANLIHDIGYLGQGLLGDPAALVMADEIISYVRRIMCGFDMDREHRAMDVISKVESGGNYLAERHTLKHFREELWMPKLANRDNPEAWEAKGALHYSDRARQKTKEILASFKPKPLPHEVQLRIDEIFCQAESILKKIDFAA